MVQGPWCPHPPPGLLSSLPMSLTPAPWSKEPELVLWCVVPSGPISRRFPSAPPHQHRLTTHCLPGDPMASRGVQCVDTGILELCALWLGTSAVGSGQDEDHPIPTPRWLRCWDPCVQGRHAPPPAAKRECEAGPQPTALAAPCCSPRWRSRWGGVRGRPRQTCPCRAQTLGAGCPRLGWSQLLT